MNSKIRVISIIGAVVILLIVSALYFLLSGIQNTSRPSFNNIPTPTPFSNNPTNQSSTLFKITSIIPQEDIKQQYYIIQQIEITFSKVVEPASFKYETSPNTLLRVATKPAEPNTLVLTPNFVWTEGITSLTILPSTKAQDGTNLNNTVQYQINTKAPESGQIYEPRASYE